MRVVRGRADSVEADQRRTREMTDRVAETGRPALRVWRPHPQVAFGRRDRQSDGYGRAKEIARAQDYAVTERDVGGRAVAFTGDTLALVLAEPVEGDHRSGIKDRYDRVLDAVQAALAECGVDAERGEPPNSFCPGSHSLQVDGGKAVGVAQRVRQAVALVGAVVVVDANGPSDVLRPVYEALGAPFDPTAVGSAGADGPTGRETITEALSGALDPADSALVRNT